jgi:cyanophycin synthetase
LVVGNRLAAAVRGESISVTGDGKTTIRQLIDRDINTDPRRGEAEEFPLDVVLVDKNPAVNFEIERQGYTPDSVLPVGKQIVVQRNGNVAFDVTHIVHPEVSAAATLAARIVGLDIAGIDMVTDDISRPLSETQGAIVEVNAGPGLLMHLKPAEGEPQPVGKAIVDSLFAEDESGRIPVVGISGSRGKTLVAQIVAHLTRLNGTHVGLACSDGLYFNGRHVDKRDCANWTASQKVLMNRAVEAAVIENSFETIIGEGLGYDRCQVGVVTNIHAEQHFGDYYIETHDQVFNVMRTQVDVVLCEGAAVLNAEDPIVAKMAELCDGEVIFFAHDANSEVVQDHLKQAGRAVLLDGDNLVLVTGEQKSVLTKLPAIPLLKGVDDAKAYRSKVESVLAAIATTWALGISPGLMQAGIEAFEIA